jgi:hypothetical protein
MLRTQSIQKKNDVIGAIASTLCLIHCLLTPVLFTLQAGMSHHHENHHESSPDWWSSIDLILLFVSLAVVIWAIRNTSKKWMKYIFAINWLFLAVIILNEKLEFLALPEELIYIPTIGLIIAHLYNHKYCHCLEDKCCTATK